MKILLYFAKQQFYFVENIEFILFRDFANL